jgi:hypothetical protein
MNISLNLIYSTTNILYININLEVFRLNRRNVISYISDLNEFFGEKQSILEFETPLKLHIIIILYWVF